MSKVKVIEGFNKMTNRSYDKKLPAVKNDFTDVVPLDSGKVSVTDNTPLEPVIESEGGVELLDQEDGWVIGVRGHRLMRFPTEKHMITIGTIGSGKGASVAIPNLLMHEGSAFSLEMAGTTYKETVNFRKHVLRQKIYVIDPWGATGEESDSINLLDTLDPTSPRFFNEAKAFANTLLKDVEVSGKDGSSSYFENNAHGLLTALIIYVKTSGSVDEEERNIPKILELASTFGTDEWHELMAQFKLDNSLYSALLKSVGNYFYKKDNENVQSIFSTMTKKFMDIMDPSVARLFKKSTFSPSELRDGNTTLYVIFKEAGDMSGSPAFLRLLVERTIAAYPNLGDGGRAFKTTKSRLLMMLDEFTNLGKIDGIDKDMATVRQKGITIWPMFQNLAQLEEVYGKNIAQTILANAAVVQVLDARDDTTLDYISKRMGKRITLIPTVQHGSNWGNSNQNNWNQAKTLGVSETISEGSSTAEVESWNDTESTGLSNSSNKTDTIGTSISDGTSQSRSKSTSYNDAYTTSVYTGYNPASGTTVRNAGLSGAYNRDATSGGITNTVSVSVGTQISDTESTQRTNTLSESSAVTSGTASSVGSARSIGGSKQNGKNYSRGLTKNSSDSLSNGGSDGTSNGGSYSVTYTPHIIPALEPWQIEDVLIDNRQLIFVRAKNKTMRIIDQKANYYEIPALMLRVNGPRVIAPPILIGNLIPPEALSYLPTPIISFNIPSFSRAVVNNLKGIQMDPFDIPCSVFSIGKAGMEKLLTARAEVDVSTEQEKGKFLAEKNKIFLTLAPDIQAKSVGLSLERDKLEIRVKAQWNDLDEQVKSMEPSHGQLMSMATRIQEKKSRIIDFEGVLKGYKEQLLEDLQYEDKYQESVKAYKGYIEYVHDLKKRWPDFKVAERPVGIGTVDLDDWRNEDLKIFISRPVGDLSRSFLDKFSRILMHVPEMPTKAERSFSPDYIISMPVNDLRNMKAKIGEGFEVSLEDLNALIKDKMAVVRCLQKAGDNRRADFFASLTAQQCVATREHFIGFIENKTNSTLHGMSEGQKRFEEWQKRDADNLSTYSRAIERFRDGLQCSVGEMRDLESLLDDHWKYLGERHEQFNHANQVLEARRARALNNMSQWSVWDGLEAQIKLLKDNASDRLDLEDSMNSRIENYSQEFDAAHIVPENTRIIFQKNEPQ